MAGLQFNKTGLDQISYYLYIVKHLNPVLLNWRPALLLLSTTVSFSLATLMQISEDLNSLRAINQPVAVVIYGTISGGAIFKPFYRIGS